MNNLLMTSKSSNISKQESKALCKNWLDHIQSTQNDYPYSEIANNSFDDIAAEIRKGSPTSTHLLPIWDEKLNDKFLHVVGGFLLYTDGDVLEPEYYFYSSKKPGHRLACTLNMQLTKHVLERLIERLNIKTFSDFKEKIIDVVAIPTMQSTVDKKQVGVSTNYTIVSREFTLFADIDEGITTYITMVSDNEYVNGQQRVIEYITNKVGQDYVGFTHYEVPRDITQADRLIQDTDIRMNSPAKIKQVDVLLSYLYPNF